MFGRWIWILTIIWKLFFVEGNYNRQQSPKQWPSWIILPSLGTTKEIKISNELNINESGKLVQTYVDTLTLDTFVVTIDSHNINPKQLNQPMEERKHGSSGPIVDLVVPMERATSLMKSFSDTLKELFSEGTLIESRRATASTPRKDKKVKKLKKLKKFLLPLLIAYKLKFLTLVPVLIGGLILLVGSTGLAGFFFALFTAVMSMKADVHVIK